MMEMKKYISLFVAMFFFSGMAQAQEAYVVYTEGGANGQPSGMFTLYYDNQKEARGGIDIKRFSDYEYRRDNINLTDVTKAVFDASRHSRSDPRPVRSNFPLPGSIWLSRRNTPIIPVFPRETV